MASRHVFARCPRCQSKLKQAVAYNGNPSEFWRVCTNPACNTYVDTYRPQEQQVKFHKDGHRIKGTFGGFGSGKTLGDEKETQKHIILTENGTGLVTANVSSQFEQTFKREFEADIPAAFVKRVSAQKQFMEFINGYRLIYRPGDDPGKLRSLNIDLAVMLEASEMKAAVFHQIKTRLRNTAATTPLLDENGEEVLEYLPNGDTKPVVDRDWRKILVESNPDSGWINTDVLLVSDKIITTGEVDDDYLINENERDRAISSHITNSNCNLYLPPGYIEDIMKNKPAWWVARYINGSFKYSEGLVYPRAVDRVVPWFQIPETWKRIVAFDYGLSDDARFIFGAIDPVFGILYIYKEVSANNRDVKELADLYKKAAADIPHGALLTNPIMDPKNNKRDYMKKDLASHFLEYGIAFKPGHISVDARILRLNTYIERDRIRFMDSCPILIREFKGYKFPDKSLDKTTKAQDKPVDKDNHSINPVEWICMELPSDPALLKQAAYDGLGNLLSSGKKAQSQDPWQFSDSFSSYSSDDFSPGDIF